MAAPPDFSRVNLHRDTVDQFREVLKHFDIAFLIDNSASMAGTPWSEALIALKSLLDPCISQDADGVDVYFFNESHPVHEPTGWLGQKTVESVQNIFHKAQQAESNKALAAARFRDILSPYVNRCETPGNAVKPLILIVITDGKTDNLVPVITDFADRLHAAEAPRHQLGITFFRVGDNDTGRAILEFLDGGLDDRCNRDIVKTTTFDTEEDGVKALSTKGLWNTLLGSVIPGFDEERQVSIEV
ncbi:hypothetical protein QBC40DRAFT_162167 [Triangularia verruculosa]|uniref:VWFA domain-containing protein n=1 Tax=Triangularia verruculosa TaxID=2587418 RepID=A0AAN7AY71_9PEZI|nr:hypothetical protein QBC40DRAFT_162167 [Triangularia verruculosa]